MKKYLFVFGLLCSFIFAADDVALQIYKFEGQKKKEKKEEAQEEFVSEEEKCSDNGFITAVDFLYLQVHNNPITVGFKASMVEEIQNAQLDLESVVVDNVRFSSKWDPGFKLALGYLSEYDKWDFTAHWKYFHTKNKKRATSPNKDVAFLAGIMGSDDIDFYDINSSWVLNLNMIDFQIGKAFQINERLNLRPFIALASNFLYQDIYWYGSGRYYRSGTNPVEGDAEAATSLKNDFWGVGLKSGLNGHWNLCKRISIYGDFAFSLLYGKTYAKNNLYVRNPDSDQQTYPGRVDEEYVETRDTVYQVKPNMEMNLGFLYSYCFEGGTLLDIKLGCVFDYFWDAYDKTNFSYYVLDTYDSLSFLGVTAGILFKF